MSNKIVCENIHRLQQRQEFVILEMARAKQTHGHDSFQYNKASDEYNNLVNDLISAIGDDAHCRMVDPLLWQLVINVEKVIRNTIPHRQMSYKKGREFLINHGGFL